MLDYKIVCNNKLNIQSKHKIDPLTAQYHAKKKS